MPAHKEVSKGVARQAVPPDRTRKAATLVYDFCVQYGICTLCKRKYALESRRMCGKCVMINRNSQQKRRDRKVNNL
jgi:hypothetical protein